MTRDMTPAEFSAALKRNGFRLIMGLWCEDTTGQTTTSFGVVYDARTRKILRRATVARVIEQRKAEAKRATLSKVEG